MSQIDGTFAMVKSDALARGDYVHILAAIKNSGLQIASQRHFHLPRTQAARLYHESVGKDYHDRLMRSVTGPAGVMFLAISGPNAVARWRALIGPTDPAKAPPDTIRGRFGTRLPDNVVHGSDSAISARREILLAQSILGDARFGHYCVPPPENADISLLENLATTARFAIDGESRHMTIGEIVARVGRLVNRPVSDYGYPHMRLTAECARKDAYFLNTLSERIRAGSAASLWLPRQVPDIPGCGHVFNYDLINTEIGRLRHVALSALNALKPDFLIDPSEVPESRRDHVAARFFERFVDLNAERLDRHFAPEIVSSPIVKLRRNGRMPVASELSLSP